MNYTEAIEFIHSRLKFGSKLGLETITQLMHRLGDPQEKLKFIHVAGTNGKGSTSAYISNILRENGFKTGMYISPFVHTFAERIQIDGQYIPPDALARHTQQVAEAVSDGLEATEFEIVTAAAFLYFYEQQCDYVVLEVGLGGRYDATNVIPPPELAVLTSISLDHTELLGDTVEKIAFDKCGIIKSGTDKVIAYCNNQQSANQVILETAGAQGVPVEFGDKSQVEILSRTVQGSRFVYQGEDYEISMLGRHQVYNAVTAITACHALGIDTHTIKRGLKRTAFKGRFEVISQDPVVIVDGAHNYDGVRAFKEALSAHFGDKKVILVMGMLKDKEYDRCVKEIAPLASLFIAAQPENPRALTAGELEAVAKQYNSHTAAVPCGKEALRYAKQQADKDTVICVCGSLYLIGTIL